MCAYVWHCVFFIQKYECLRFICCHPLLIRRPGERAQLVYYVPPGQAVPCVGCGPNHEEMVLAVTEEGAQHCAKYPWPKLAGTDQLTEWLISYHSNRTIC